MQRMRKCTWIWTYRSVRIFLCSLHAINCAVSGLEFASLIVDAGRESGVWHDTPGWSVRYAGITCQPIAVAFAFILPIAICAWIFPDAMRKTKDAF